MYETRIRLPKTADRQQFADPAQLAELLEAWEIAKSAYREVLFEGIDRPDLELARDPAYGQLLQAGVRIHRLGGTEAVKVVSRYLGHSENQDSDLHFRRLWAGLISGKGH